MNVDSAPSTGGPSQDAANPPPSAAPPAPALYANALPIPNTWYFVGLSAELRPGELRPIRMAGAD